jgi:hypothetical protein
MSVTEIGTRFHSIENHRPLISALVRQRDRQLDTRMISFTSDHLAHLSSSSLFGALFPLLRPGEELHKLDAHRNSGASVTRLDELDSRDELVHHADSLVPRLEQLLGDLNRDRSAAGLARRDHAIVAHLDAAFGEERVERHRYRQHNDTCERGPTQDTAMGVSKRDDLEFTVLTCREKLRQR